MNHIVRNDIESPTIILIIISSLLLFFFLKYTPVIKAEQLPQKFELTQKSLYNSNEVANLQFYESKNNSAKKANILLISDIMLKDSSYNIEEKWSYIKTFQKNGYNVWGLDWDWEALSKNNELKGTHDASIILDHIIKKTLNLAIKDIQSSNNNDIHLFGFGLSSTMIIGYIENEPSAIVKSSILLAPIISTRFPDRVYKQLLDKQLPETKLLSIDNLLDNKSPFSDKDTYFSLIMTNEKLQYDLSYLRKKLSSNLKPFPTSFITLLKNWLKDGCCKIENNDLFNDLKKITIPVMMISGVADNISRSDSIEQAFIRINSTRKQYVKCSKTNFYAKNTGHIDLLWSPHVVKKLQKEMLNWLDGKKLPEGTPLLPPDENFQHVF